MQSTDQQGVPPRSEGSAWSFSRSYRRTSPRHRRPGQDGRGKGSSTPPADTRAARPIVALSPAGWAGQWYWMRSPDQEQRVVMALYNRYCIRCHGIDGRGVWDIPDVPDFTDPRWQASRTDRQIVNILMEGRGAVMPTFRGTLTLEESWAMSHYLRTFVPGTESARPDVGRAADPRPAAAVPARSGTAPSARVTMDLPPLPGRRITARLRTDESPSRESVKSPDAEIGGCRRGDPGYGPRTVP